MQCIWTTGLWGKSLNAFQVSCHFRLVDAAGKYTDHFRQHTGNFVEADKRDDYVSVFGKEVGPAVAVAATADAGVRIFFYQVLQADDG